MSGEGVLFFGFGAAALASAVFLVAFARSGVAAALAFGATMGSLAGIAVLLGAHLIAAVQAVMAAGVVLVLLVFSGSSGELGSRAFQPARTGGAAARWAGAIGLVAAIALASWRLPRMFATAPPPEGFGGHGELGAALFTQYAVPLEVVALVLLASLLGAALLARRRT